MEEFTIVDTDILIDVSRGISFAIDFMNNLKKSSLLGISVITKLELIAGCRNKQELRALDKFLSHFLVINHNENI